MTRSDSKQGQRSRGGKKAARIAGGTVLGLAVIGGVAYGADLFMSRDSVPRGVTVGGVEIGGLQQAAAVDKLQSELGAAGTTPVTVRAGDLSSTFVPQDAGIAIDWEATVAGAGKQSANPITRLNSFFTTHEIEPASTIDEQVFAPQLDRIRTELSPAAVEAGVNLNGGTINVDPQPKNGQQVDATKLKDAVTSDWLKPGGVEVDAQVTEPTLGDKVVKSVQDGDAAKALSAPITVHGRDGVDGVIPVDRMAEVVSFVPDGDKFRTDVNADAARSILNEALGATETKKQNATISYAGGTKSITPSQDGVTIDWDKTLEGFSGRVLSSDQRTLDAVYTDEPATFTTDMAEKATFDEVVGEFSTGGFAEASGENIRRVAEIVNGAIVAPGDTFSLNGYTGPRGTAQGFVESGIILNGHADKAVGGGISQFATTLYNAAYFAGMEDVAHTPHSYYISRYPAGREATVYEGAIDLQFKNTSQYPVRIVTNFDGSNISVALMGVKTVNVESQNGGRWNYTAPQPMTLSGDTCTPSTGAQGFTTSDTRIIRDLSGNELSRETTTTVYDPSPIVTCK